MLHAPTAESGKDTDSSRSTPEPGRLQKSSARSPRPQNPSSNQAALRMLARSGVFIQPKLAINAPGDAFEQEADRVADRVMHSAAPLSFSPATTSAIQRKCAHCEEEEKGLLQRKEAGEACDMSSEASTDAVQSVLRSPGQPLDRASRSFMEQRFGYDFGGVRIHSDAAAARSARQVGALAYTSGSHIVFGAGQFNAGSTASRRLLAHELTHTIQQRAAGGRPGAMVQREPDEQAAQPQLYNIRLTYSPSQTENHDALPLPEALKALTHFANRIDAHLYGGIEGHKALQEVHDDHFIVAGISDFFGGESIPSLDIWNAPQVHLDYARMAIAQGNITLATSFLQLAATETRRADLKVYEYRENTVSGAERAVFGLEVVKVASATFVTVATGGTAGVFVGAGYAGVQRLAGEASAVHYGLQDHIDWAGVAFDTAFALVAGKFGGRFSGAIAKRLGGKLAAQFVAGLVTGRASGIVHAVTRDVFDAARGEKADITVDGLIDRVAQQLTVRQAFLDLVSTGVGIGTQSLTTPSSPTPAPGEPPQRLSGPTRVIQGGVSGSVPMQNGRVVSPARTTTVASGGGARAVAGGAPAVAPAMPEPVVQPQPRPRPALAPVPAAPPQAVTPSAPAGGTSSNVGAAAAINAATNAASGSNTNNAAPQVRLVLPPQKAVHAGLYGNLIRARQLEHTPGVPRHTAQAGNWDRELRPGAPMEMVPEIWRNFSNMGVSEARRLRPNWSNSQPRVAMQVDHRVEWQLLGTANRAWGDTITNYELLDQPSNGSAGSTLRNNIEAERQRLANTTGNAAWLTQRIVFTDLLVPSTQSGAQRWLPEQIQQGDHYFALLRHERERIRRGR